MSGRDGAGGGTYRVAAVDEHLGLLLGPLFALLLLDDEAVVCGVVCDPAHLALAFGHGVGDGCVVAEVPGGDETGGRGEGEGDAAMFWGGEGHG